MHHLHQQTRGSELSNYRAVYTTREGGTLESSFPVWIQTVMDQATLNNWRLFAEAEMTESADAEVRALSLPQVVLVLFTWWIRVCSELKLTHRNTIVLPLRGYDGAQFLLVWFLEKLPCSAALSLMYSTWGSTPVPSAPQTTPFNNDPKTTSTEPNIPGFTKDWVQGCCCCCVGLYKFSLGVPNKLADDCKCYCWKVGVTRVHLKDKRPQNPKRL